MLHMFQLMLTNYPGLISIYQMFFDQWEQNHRIARSWKMWLLSHFKFLVWRQPHASPPDACLCLWGQEGDPDCGFPTLFNWHVDRCPLNSINLPTSSDNICCSSPSFPLPPHHHHIFLQASIVIQSLSACLTAFFLFRFSSPLLSTVYRPPLCHFQTLPCFIQGAQLINGSLKDEGH